ncbi:dihydrofolate reductase [Candidatus Liberibacter africanus]|uniref:Dihydrofolate reductase n=1 Tax=Candidatus Liberibacter africanus PTSAPSY TaxID=1277257 RepID=A0A0G3I5R1_LIBAF|nr:dihydrofolate reductase [Candidatus Liberibacter africanus]AKK20600.1 dihydrofolate reductase protein [Candidatus Liberibacter africanus PTSAPSY]
MKEIILIAAITRNNVIGNGGGIPWQIASDLKRFKNMTMGYPIIMGYHTFQSIGRVLPGRTNIVITRNNMRHISLIPEIIPASSISHAFDLAANIGSKKVFVVGGGTIYAQTISLAHTLYITHVEQAVEGDVFFPAIDPCIWQKEKQEIVLSSGKGDDYPTRFVIYHRDFP